MHFMPLPGYKLKCMFLIDLVVQGTIYVFSLMHETLSASHWSLSTSLCRYLHEICSPSIIHKNFKSSNILLDTELNPHISDAGLASFVPHAEFQVKLEANLQETCLEVYMVKKHNSLFNWLFVMDFLKCCLYEPVNVSYGSLQTNHLMFQNKH